MKVYELINHLSTHCDQNAEVEFVSDFPLLNQRLNEDHIMNIAVKPYSAVDIIIF